jgi:hypothetical protein
MLLIPHNVLPCRKTRCLPPQDLQEVSSKFAVSSIQLRFTFMRRLHPFFPPRVEVVRPHLSTPLPGALASYPLLRLEHWHPTLTMTQVVDNLRTFLEVRWGWVRLLAWCDVVRQW